MRDPASISNAVSEDEKITMPEAIACIKWLQGRCDYQMNQRNRLNSDIVLALATDMAERVKNSK